MSRSSTSLNVVYVDHCGTSSRLAYRDSAMDTDRTPCDNLGIGYFLPGDAPQRSPRLAVRTFLQVALAEGDSRYGGMLRRLAK